MVKYTFMVDGAEESMQFDSLPQAVGLLSVHVLTMRAKPISMQDGDTKLSFEDLKPMMVSGTVTLERLETFWDKADARHENAPSAEVLAARAAALAEKMPPFLS